MNKQTKTKTHAQGEVKTKKVKQPKVVTTVKRSPADKVARTAANKARRIEKDRKAREEAKQRRETRQHLKRKAKANVAMQNEAAEFHIPEGVVIVHTLTGYNSTSVLGATQPTQPDARDMEMLKRWQRTRRSH